ncbi:hypothetical protein JCM8547_003271 [Rhodosporidiobolus lusitaniae]
MTPDDPNLETVEHAQFSAGNQTDAQSNWPAEGQTGHEQGEKEEHQREQSSVGDNDNSFNRSTAGSIIDHGEADLSGTGDSSFEPVELDSPGGCTQNEVESSFEVVVSEEDKLFSLPASTRPAPPRIVSGIGDELETSAKLLEGLNVGEEERPHHQGLLNPEAPTFESSSIPAHMLVFPPGTTFETIILQGKDEIGELTADARAALVDLGLKSIPSMHGPPSLPYARCPSGIDAFLLPPSCDEDVFVFDPDAPPRPANLPLPLPGNSRFARTTRIAPRSTSGPAALETVRGRQRITSNASSGKGVTVGSAVPAKKLPVPLHPTLVARVLSGTKPPTSTVPTASTLVGLQQQHSFYQMQLAEQAQRNQQAQLAQQAHLAHQMQLAQAQVQGHTAPEPTAAFAQHDFHPLNPYAHPGAQGNTYFSTPSPLPPMFSAPRYTSYPIVPPYTALPAQANPATLAAQILSSQSRRASIVPTLGSEVDSLMLLQQLTAQQHQQQQQAKLAAALLDPLTAAAAAAVQAGSRSTSASYNTAPDEQDSTEWTDSNDEPSHGEHLFYPSLGHHGEENDLGVHRTRSSASSNENEAYLQRRRQSAAPYFSVPGGRKPSVSPAVDVGPRRASVAPQARLGKEQPYVTPSSRRASVTAPSSGGLGAAPVGRKTFGKRVFSDVGNTLSSRPGGGAAGKLVGSQQRHASDSTTNWRRRDSIFDEEPGKEQHHQPQADKSTPSSSSAFSPPLTLDVASPVGPEGWNVVNVVESVAQALLSPTYAGEENPQSGQTTPRPEQQQQQQGASTSKAVGTGGAQTAQVKKAKRNWKPRGKGKGKGKVAGGAGGTGGGGAGKTPTAVAA